VSRQDYSPKAALEAFLMSRGRTQELAKLQREGIKRKMFSGGKPIVIDDRPKDVIPEKTTEEAPKVPLLCFPLQAWLDGAQDLPKDIHGLPKTGSALKTHVRPDGAVFLGLFEIPGSKNTGVVVFGDKGTPQGTAVAVSQQYREEVLAELDAIRAGREAALAGTPVPTNEPLVTVS